METGIHADRSATVRALHVAPGQQIDAKDLLAELAPDPAGDIAYLCGNPNMVDACFDALKEHGLPIPQIRREKYVSST